MRQPLAPTHRDLARSPVDVVEFQSDDFSGTKTKVREQSQDGKVPPADRRALVARPEQPIDLLRAEILRKRRQSPVRHPWYAGREVPFDRPPLQEEAKDRSQGGHP